MFGFSNRVTFDHVRQDRTEKSVALDYSPLRRVSARSFAMGLLVSMGGLIFGYVAPPYICRLYYDMTGSATTSRMFADAY